MSEAHGMNYGHGHVFPRPDGAKARCGGPGICSVCAKEAERAKAATSPTESGTPRTTAEKNQRAIEKFKCPVVIEAEQLVKFVEAERQLAEKQGLLEAETILRREWCKLAGERAGELTAERQRAEGIAELLRMFRDEIVAAIGTGGTHYEGCENNHKNCKWLKLINDALAAGQEE